MTKKAKQLCFLNTIMCMLWMCISVNAQNNQATAVLKVLQKQQDDWNRGDIRAFMQGYWQHDSLQFISPKGVTYGWLPVLDNYLRSYPDTAAMGKLSFDIEHIYEIPPNHAYVVGKWKLTRTALNDAGGHFTLLFRNNPQGWHIISDHTH